ncbi:hypothetical protein PIB30_000135 [Stylosanthes scabra]|uniref:Uncharacterized protein n=1 Tax=Stylosanthes scabra TaxID=79078 RepID=A0ABU6R2Y4_9FABA|nr:hypothetical protein [Stylosanthes scabra]
MTLTQLREIVTKIELNSKEKVTKIKRAFILYIQKALLCPNNSASLDPKTLPTILDVTNSRGMNRARHIYSYLLQSITNTRTKNLKIVDGCVFALLITYFQETYFEKGSQEKDAQPQWLDFRRGQILRKRIKVEFEDPAVMSVLSSNPAMEVEHPSLEIPLQSVFLGNRLSAKQTHNHQQFLDSLFSNP